MGAGWRADAACRREPRSWPHIPAVRLVGGVLALWLSWMAVVQARNIINYLMSVLVLVWVADVFAYFAGRTFGLKFTKNKLAPSISPGKSWERGVGRHAGGDCSGSGLELG